jgi:hypothetical protein
VGVAVQVTPDHVETLQLDPHLRTAGPPVLWTCSAIGMWSVCDRDFTVYLLNVRTINLDFAN